MLMMSLADGTHWLLRSGDAGAERVLTRLGQVMGLSLPEGAGPMGQVTDEVLVVSGDRYHITEGSPLVCVVVPPSDDVTMTSAATYVALVIARATQVRGGVLLHGALAAYSGPEGADLEQGVVLAGRGSVGKTTASNRLRMPWRPLCDDATLVVRDAQGGYWAHPWPTWSRFYSYDGQPAPGGQWPVEQAVPLRALFFLSQAAEDRVEPRSRAQATAMLMEVAEQVTYPLIHFLSTSEIQALHRERMSIVQDLVNAIPAFTLYNSLTGAFWTAIEAVLSHSPSKAVLRWDPAQTKIDQGVTSRLDDASLRFAYRGLSMIPTLREPDLVEVRPYGAGSIRCGDVVYYRTSDADDSAMVVHRVVEVSPDHVRTRGDNNGSDDPFPLPRDRIIGRVVAAQHRGRRRIAGGWRGVWIGYGCRVRWWVCGIAAEVLSGAYHAAARAGVVSRVLPARLRPRVVVFDTKVLPVYKVLMGSREIGRYDYRTRRWQILRPLRLLVDETVLPHPETHLSLLRREAAAQATGAHPPTRHTL